MQRGNIKSSQSGDSSFFNLIAGNLDKVSSHTVTIVIVFAALSVVKIVFSFINQKRKDELENLKNIREHKAQMRKLDIEAYKAKKSVTRKNKVQVVNNDDGL